MTKPRFIVLALDAASPALLREWAADGALPNLRALLQRGLTANIAGLDGFYIGATWPSFFTGTGPGRHGFHYQLTLEPGSYRLRAVADGEPTRTPPFWRALSEAGRRVAILDVPLSKLDPTLNGVQVVEWGVHDHLYGYSAAPNRFGREILRQYGRHPVGAHCDATRLSSEDYRTFVDQLVAATGTKARLTAEVLARENWDFLIQVFSESHCVGHQCWHLHDPSHPAFDPVVARGMEDPVRRVYRALDDAVGTLMPLARDATLIVMSGHGMTHWYGATFLLKDILFALGAAVPRLPDAGAAGGSAHFARRAWRALPEPVRKVVRPLKDRWGGRASTAGPLLTAGMDPSRSRCFPIGNGLGTGALRLNVAGREPLGVLRPGAEVEAFVAQLSADLLSLTYADTGERVVDRVLQKRKVLAGPAAEGLPDLVIEWSRTRAIGSTALADGRGATVRLRHPRVGVIEGANAYGRTGEHEPGGFFVAVGADVRPGALGREVSLLDLAPTICGALGCDASDFEGQAIPELIPALGRVLNATLSLAPPPDTAADSTPSSAGTAG